MPDHSSNHFASANEVPEPLQTPAATLPSAIFTRHPDAGNALRDKPDGAPTAVIELRVRNHPGTMSHITGLFARRGFNLEAILCVPLAGTAESCMLLLVANEPRLEQVERQLAKLFDVLAIRHRPDVTPDYFVRSMPP